MPLQRFEFTIDRMPTDEEVNQLFHRYDDMGTRWIPAQACATVWVDRDAPTLIDAILSAVRDCEAVGLSPVGVVPNGTPDDSDQEELTAVELALQLRKVVTRGTRMAAIKALLCG